MLTIKNDPAGVTGQKSYAWDYTESIQKNIERKMPGGGADCLVFVNGAEVDPATCLELDRLPCFADSVLIVKRPEGIETLILIAVVAAVVVSFALMPKPQGVQTAKDSPNNQLTGQTNIARAYQGIPDVYGSRRVWPDLIQPSVVEYVDHVKIVTETMCISRGKGGVTDVRFADTPLDNIQGSEFEVFEPASGAGYPENRVTTVPNVVEAFAVPEVDGQEIQNSFDSVTEFGDYAMTAIIDLTDYYWEFNFDETSVNGFVPKIGEKIKFQFNSLEIIGVVVNIETMVSSLKINAITTTNLGVISGSGNITISKIGIGPFTLPIESSKIRFNTVFLRGLEGSVVIDAELWASSSSGSEISGSRQLLSFTFTANTKDQRFFTTTITPGYGSGLYQIQFTRLTADNDSVAKLEGLFAIREYATKTFPGVTLIRCKTRATLEATSGRDRKFNCRFARHVRTLTSDTVSASSNFARIMAHIWTVSGNNIAELDTAALQAINTEHGETNARLRFDGSLDDADMSLGERLQLVANHARCLVWRDGTKWTVTRDQARDYPELQLDYRNLAARGESAISYSSHLPASKDGVEVEYVKPDTQATKAYTRLNISSGTPTPGASQNPLKIKLMGCTNTAQAENRAYLEANKLLYQRQSVTDDVLSDGGIVGPGSLVRWIDPNDFYGDDGLQAGEVLAIAGTTITTSEPLHWGTETTGRIMFTGADGLRLGAPVTVTPGAAPNKAVLASVPAGIYVAGGDRQLGSRYAFAVGLTESEIEGAGLYTVTGIKPATGTQTYRLELAQYDPRIYSAD